MTQLDKKIIVNYDYRVSRVAVLENGRLVEIYIERPLQHRVVGNIYKGTVANILPGMEAAFVDIGLERNAFLYVDDVLPYRDYEERRSDPHGPIENILSVGEEIMVQVIKEPFSQKGARLTGQITIPGRYVVLVPGAGYVGVSRRIEDLDEKERLRNLAEKIRPEGMGIIIRTVAESADESLLRHDIKYLCNLWRRIQKRFHEHSAPATLYQDLALTCRVARDLLSDDVNTFMVDNIHEHEKVLEILDYTSPHLKNRVKLYKGAESIFDHYNIEKDINKALERQVWLKCGGYLVIDEIEALTIIDVNTGRYTGRKNLAETVLRTNLEAAEEIAYQIRLRDIGGIIIVDFIDMDTEEHRRKVLDKLSESFKNDRMRTYILGLTNLGLVEMTRKKVRQDLAAFLQQPCPYCEGAGRVLTPLVVGIRIEKELKKQLPAVESEAVLIEAHPEVAALLIGTGGSNLRKLENEIGKYVFVRGNEDIHLEKYRVISTGSLDEISQIALPVKPGDILGVQIEEPHIGNPGNGIARYHGFVIDVSGAADCLGQKINVEIREVNRTFARAEKYNHSR
ncbi:MAG: Rne/Rng family ribonuclease [Dethiobacteria bacterium]